MFILKQFLWYWGEKGGSMEWGFSKIVTSSSLVVTFVNACFCRMRPLMIHCCSEGDSFPGSYSQLSSLPAVINTVSVYVSSEQTKGTWASKKTLTSPVVFTNLLWTQHDFFLFLGVIILKAPEGSSTEETHSIIVLSSVCQGLLVFRR